MRKVSIIIKEMAAIENNKYIKEQHKPALLQKLQAELDHATGQQGLPGLEAQAEANHEAAKAAKR